MKHYHFKSAHKLAALVALSAVIGLGVGTADPVQAQEAIDFAEASPASVAALESATTITEETYAKNQIVAETFDVDAHTAPDGFTFDNEGQIKAVTIGGETAEVTQEKPEVRPAPTYHQPNRISTNLAADPSTSLNAQWHSSYADEAARLYVSKSQDMSNAVSYQPEIHTIVDGFHIQTTPDGYYVYAIMWDEENDEVFTSDKKDPFIAVNRPEEVVGYFTDHVFTANNLQWLDKGYDNWALALPYPAMTEYAYKVTATGLDSDTLYYYQVGNPLIEEGLSPVGRFRTAADGKEDFRFVHYTDTQNAFSSDQQRPESDYTLSTAHAILVTAPDADFVVHTGDVVNDDWNDTEWTSTLNAINPLVEAMPHMMVVGNHDNENQLIHLNPPHELDQIDMGSIYAVDYNGAHFIVLNTEDDQDGGMISDQQMAWFDQRLQDAYHRRQVGEIDWIIVAYHRPLFSASYHSLEDESVQASRNDLMRKLDQYDVDLVLNGHDHNLAITYPLLYDGDVFGTAKRDGSRVGVEGQTTTFYQPEGTVFAVIGTAGTKTYDAIYANKSYEWIIENEDIHTTYQDLFGYEVTEDDFDYFRSLMARDQQPFNSPYYVDGHSNARESNIQHFAVVDVTADTITYQIYEVVGEEIDMRDINLVHTYVITKRPAPQGSAAGSTVVAGQTGAPAKCGDKVSPVSSSAASSSSTSSSQVSAVAESDEEAALPQTGTTSVILWGASSLLAGLGLALRRKDQ